MSPLADLAWYQGYVGSVERAAQNMPSGGLVLIAGSPPRRPKSLEVLQHAPVTPAR
jgi:hypothetical protein